MLYSALVLGLVSSLHCVGMCAPLMLALPFDKTKLVFRLVSYHIGRSFTYAVLGLLFGFVGKGLAVAGFQQSLSVLLVYFHCFRTVFFDKKHQIQPPFDPLSIQMDSRTI